MLPQTSWEWLYVPSVAFMLGVLLFGMDGLNAILTGK